MTLHGRTVIRTSLDPVPSGLRCAPGLIVLSAAELAMLYSDATPARALLLAQLRLITRAADRAELRSRLNDELARAG